MNKYTQVLTQQHIAIDTAEDCFDKVIEIIDYILAKAKLLIIFDKGIVKFQHDND